ncbi:hypothetical protein P7K49_012501 [Saguinus oedipus]|uniref:Uncharacterized protein n=1 Tax=Saguinus oedipus TaxID=9490 RepID=A0ABQ9VTP5_SAGOE|nr:hypothetical protein P7K49_012501 [Saguinus oedipus]
MERTSGRAAVSESLSPYTTWLSTISDTDVLLAEWDKSGVVTVDMGGHIRLWETGLERLQRSLMEWRNMIGQDDRNMQETETADYYKATTSKLEKMSKNTYPIERFLPTSLFPGNANLVVSNKQKVEPALRWRKIREEATKVKRTLTTLETAVTI